MRRDILLVRHGENRANLTREFSYRNIDYGLTQRGVVESLRTALWIRQYCITGVFSSPLRRAVETGAIIASLFGFAVEIVEDFREINVGSLEGQSTSENWQLHNSILDDWKRGCWTRAFPNGESFEELMHRVRRGLTHVASTNSKRAVVVTHGGVLHAIRYGLLDNPIPADSPTCSVSQLSVDLSVDTLRCGLLSAPFVGHLSGINHGNESFDPNDALNANEFTRDAILEMSENFRSKQ